MPDSYCETPNGLLLIANGVQPVLRWDGLQTEAEPAGVQAPTTAITLGCAGVGAIVGTYQAYSRFIDYLDNPSSLSPVSASFTPSSSTGQITNVSNATPITVTSPGHGLVTGSLVKIVGVGGATGANDTWQVTVVDGDNFTLDASASAGDYTGGGVWTAGAAVIAYFGVPLPAESKVVRRQILRNLDGEGTTYYVDIDTTDLTSTAFASSNSDGMLAAGTSVPLNDPETGRPTAFLFSPPPNHKAVLAEQLGRIFAAGEVNYTEGAAAVVQGSATVVGVGTEWTAEMVGRAFYASAAQARYTIAALDPTAQVLQLDQPYLYGSNPFSSYSIRPQPAERRLVYYTEAGQPESWPAINALQVQEDGDEITGLMVHESFLYILEERHVWRFTFQTDPATDGYCFLANSSRGCINNRCWVTVDGAAYLLDFQGVYAFQGGEEAEPVSIAIQDIFRASEGPYEINWQASAYFHAVQYPAQETIRWFLALSGHYLPRHAIAFNYRLKRWWVEEYPFPVGSSALVRSRGNTVPFVGASGRRILALWSNALDGVDASGGTVRGTATASGLLSLTDAAASFGPGLAGHPVCIADGRGVGQTRIISAVSGQTITIDRPWTVRPDATSVYQLGGIPWRYRTAWFRFFDDEEENPRRIEVLFEPTASPALMRLNLFLDTATGAVTWQAPFASADADGVRSDSGSPDLVADLTKISGFIQKRFDDRREFNIDGPRYSSWQLSGAKGKDDFIVYQLTLDGVI